MARELDEDELIGNWTLAGDELEQLSGRRGAAKLGFALLLRFYAVHGRFPAGRGEIPDQAVAHVARLVDVPAAELGFYEWDGRTIKAHRADVRRDFGFRECSVEDVIYPAVPGGHETLVALLREYKAKGTSWRQHRQRVFKASYTSHYRAGLIQIIEVLGFGRLTLCTRPWSRRSR